MNYRLNNSDHFHNNNNIDKRKFDLRLFFPQFNWLKFHGIFLFCLIPIIRYNYIFFFFSLCAFYSIPVFGWTTTMWWVQKRNRFFFIRKYVERCKTCSTFLFGLVKIFAHNILCNFRNNFPLILSFSSTLLVVHFLYK